MQFNILSLYIIWSNLPEEIYLINFSMVLWWSWNIFKFSSTCIVIIFSPLYTYIHTHILIYTPPLNRPLNEDRTSASEARAVNRNLKSSITIRITLLSRCLGKYRIIFRNSIREVYGTWRRVLHKSYGLFATNLSLSCSSSFLFIFFFPSFYFFLSWIILIAIFYRAK